MQMLARRSGAATSGKKANELASELGRASHLVVEDPCFSLDVVEACERAPRLLGKVAEVVCRALEEQTVVSALRSELSAIFNISGLRGCSS